ncbi:hypothetical protein JTB14_015903 [Gonioctena quinquepunctata]|nr:hypothetical protein JTB14_015903 [Gonioctena quinquepunctata]
MVKRDSKEKTQKLIIPRGTIDSADTTIIEIPVKLKRRPVVVAKRRNPEKTFIADNREYTIESMREAGQSYATALDSSLPPEYFHSTQ